MQFPTGGNMAHEPLARERKLTWLDSGADSKVWMEEDYWRVKMLFPEIIFSGIFYFVSLREVFLNETKCK